MMNIRNYITAIIMLCTMAACKKTDSNIGIIISYDSEESFNYSGIRIHIIPVWKWCGQEFDLYDVA